MKIEVGDPVIVDGGQQTGSISGVYDENGNTAFTDEEATFCVVAWQDGSFSHFPLALVETKRMN